MSYSNSKFTTSNKDSLKREKPFYNICKFRVNVAVRATDLDTKDVTIVADDEGAYGQSFVLSLKNRKWMKQGNFANLLDRMGYTRAKYGCESAWGPDADRHAKLLINREAEGSLLEAYLQVAGRTAR